MLKPKRDEGEFKTMLSVQLSLILHPRASPSPAGTWRLFNNSLILFFFPGCPMISSHLISCWVSVNNAHTCKCTKERTNRHTVKNNPAKTFRRTNQTPWSDMAPVKTFNLICRNKSSYLYFCWVERLFLVMLWLVSLCCPSIGLGEISWCYPLPQSAAFFLLFLFFLTLGFLLLKYSLCSSLLEALSLMYSRIFVDSSCIVALTFSLNVLSQGAGL